MTYRYRAYLDENGHSGLSKSLDINSRYLTVTSAIFETQYVADVLAPLLDRLKKDFFSSHHPDSPIVLHANEIKGKRWPFDALKAPSVQKAFDAALLEVIDKLDFTVISVTIDKNTFHTRYPNWSFDHYHLCFYNFMERYYMFLQDRNAKGDVMIESRNSKQDEPVKDLYRSIFVRGTDRINNFRNRITSTELKVKPKYMNIPGLQIADIVSAPIRRYVLLSKYSEQIQDSHFSDEAFSILSRKIRKSKSGNMWGYGLKNL